jgi:hypothetical protein
MRAPTSRLSPLNLYGTTLRIYDNGGRSFDRRVLHRQPRDALADTLSGLP